MDQLYDNHSYPEPFLVFTGLIFLFPAYTALEKEEYYLACALVFLTSTTVLFHGIRWKYFFYLDAVSMINFIGYGVYLSPTMTNKERYPILFAASYGFYTYVIGMKHKLFSFDPDWNTQMFFHSLLHIFSAYATIVYLKTIA